MELYDDDIEDRMEEMMREGGGVQEEEEEGGANGEYVHVDFGNEGNGALVHNLKRMTWTTTTMATIVTTTRILLAMTILGINELKMKEVVVVVVCG
jgi:hypothetical protein